MKKCRRCGDECEREGFWKRAVCPDGLDTWCKRCRSASQREYHSLPKVKARHNALSKADYETHRERYKQYKREYYEQNKEARKALQRAYYHSHQQQIRSYRKRWYSKRRNDPEFKRKQSLNASAWNRRNRWHPRVCASKAVSLAIRCGLLKKLPCEVCGTSKDVHAHHHKGYELANWFIVQWLCATHHKAAHGWVSWDVKER